MNVFIPTKCEEKRAAKGKNRKYSLDDLSFVTENIVFALF